MEKKITVNVLWSDNKVRPATVTVTEKSTNASIARAAMKYAWHSTIAYNDARPVKTLFGKNSKRR